MLTPTAHCQICWNSGENATIPTVCTAWGVTGSQWDSRVRVQSCTISRHPEQTCPTSKWWREESGKRRLWSGLLLLEPCISGCKLAVVLKRHSSTEASKAMLLYTHEGHISKVNICSWWDLVYLYASGGWWPQNQSKHRSLLLSCNLLQTNLTQ